MGYNFVTQLFPALVLCLGERPKVSATAAFAGIVAGELTVALVTITGSSIATLAPSAPQFLKDMNVGIVALIVNVLVLVVVGVLVRRRAPQQALVTDL
jgi:SSS family solute:Na+ symporter